MGQDTSGYMGQDTSGQDSSAEVWLAARPGTYILHSVLLQTCSDIGNAYLMQAVLIAIEQGEGREDQLRTVKQ